MAAIVSGFQHLIQAVLDLIQGAVGTVTWLITSTVELVFGLISNVAGFFEHLVAFLLRTLSILYHVMTLMRAENIVTIGVLVALAFVFLTFQARQGKSVGGKKTL